MYAALAFACGARAADAPLSANDPTRALPPTGVAPAASLDYRPPAAPPAALDTTPRLVLRGVSFDNARAVPEFRLRPAWSDLEGKTVSLSDLRAIGRRAEAIYVQSGYPFVAVMLTVQEVKDGVVHYKVVEGRITDLTVLGSDPHARRQATAMLLPLVNRQPLSLGAVNRAYQIARDVPGLSLSGTLRRGSEPGGMDLVVSAKREEWRTYANANNLYAESVGPWGVLAGVDHFGASQYGDQTSLQVYTSAPVGRQVMVRMSEALHVDPNGTVIGLSGLWGRAEPQGDLSPLALATDVFSLRLEASRPIWKRPDASLVVNLALEGSNQRTRVYGSTGLSDDKLRDLSLSLSAEKTGALGRIAASGEIHQNLQILGASRKGDVNLSRLGADPQATIFRFGVEGQTVSWSGLQLAVRLDTQYAAHALATPDQYSVGNLTIGRGYQPAALLGDSAVAGSFELRNGPYKIGRGLYAQPFVFLDAARLWNHGAAAFAERSVSSAGGGVRLELNSNLHMDLIYAVPQDPPLGLGEKRPGPSVLVNVTVGFNDIFNAIHRRIASGGAK